MADASIEVPQSRLGKRPVILPKGVSATLKVGSCEVKGPKGSLKLTLPPGVSVVQDGDSLRISANVAPGDAARLQGLGRALVANTVQGCAVGYSRTLELVGVGYRAELKGQEIHLALGLSHTPIFKLPAGITADIPKDKKGTIINLASADKGLIGQAAATIRGYRPPEPYGGKGVRYKGENVRRKAGKAGKK